MSENREGVAPRAWTPSISSQIHKESINPSTVWGWFVVWLPALPFVGMIAMDTAIHSAIPLWLFASTGVLALVMTVGAAYMDVQELKTRGHETAKPWLALILPVAYLWMRGLPFRRDYVQVRELWTHVVAMPAIALGSVFWSSLAITLGSRF